MPTNNESTKWLYEQLSSRGFNVGRDAAEFDNLMRTNKASREWAYKAAKSNGLNVGKDMAEFDNLVAPKPSTTQTTVKPTVKPTQQKPWKPSPMQRAVFQSRVANATSGLEQQGEEARQRMENMQEYGKHLGGGRTVQGDLRVNPQSKKIERTYLTPTGERTFDKMAADAASREYRDVVSQEKEIRRRQLEEEAKMKHDPSLWETVTKSLGAGLTRAGAGLIDAMQWLTSGAYVEDPSSPTGYIRTRDYEDALADPTDPLTIASSVTHNKADELSEQAQPHSGKKGFLDMLWDGEIGGFLQKGVATTGESLPMTLSAYSPYTMTLNAVSMAGSNFRENTLENPDIPEWKRASQAIGSAAIEQAVEKYADPIFKYVGGGKIVKGVSKDASEKISTEITKDATETLTKRIYGRLKNIGKDAVGEGAEEVMSNVGNDLLGETLDLVSGSKDYGLRAQWEKTKKENPDANLWDFSKAKAKENVEAFIGGAMAGAYTSGTAQLSSKALQYSFDKLGNGSVEENDGKPLNPINVDVAQSYDDGYSEEETTELQDTKNLYELRRGQVAKMLGVDAEQVDETIGDPINFIAELQQLGRNDEIQPVLDYVNSRAKRDGMMQRVRDDMDGRVGQSNATIDSRVNRETGMIQPVTLKVQDEKGNDRRVYVMNGNLVTYDDGSGIDSEKSSKTITIRYADSGAFDMVSPDAILGIEQPIDPETEKQTAAEAIRQEFAQQESDRIDGKVAFNPGDVYNVIGENGQPTQIQVAANEKGISDNGDGTVNVSSDGGQTVAPMRKEDIQAMVDAANRARVEQAEAEREQMQAEERSKYTSGQIKVRNSDGTERRGVLTGYVDKDGKHEYYLEGDLNRLHYASEQELDEMLTDYRQDEQQAVPAEEPSYSQNDEVTLVDENGNEVRGSIVSGANEDGLYEVETDRPINGRRVNLFTADELDSMRADASGNSGAENIPTAAETPTPLQRIPRNEKGEPVFEQADSPETAWDALVEFSDGNTETAHEIADIMVEEKRKTLEKAQKLKTKGRTPGEIRASKNTISEQIAQAESEYRAWQQIAGVEQARERALRARQEAEARRVAAERAAAEKAEREAREEAERVEREALEGVPDFTDDTPQAARARGYRRVNGHKVDRQEPLDARLGKEVEVKFDDKNMPVGRVALIEASQLQPSHINGYRNPLHFLDEAQPKERNDDASVLAAHRIAAHIRPQEITGSVKAYSGSPNVNARGEVIQGNNRSAALLEMWSGHPDQAAIYKQYLKDHAAEFGLTAEDVDAMQEPVLVNMLDVPDDAAITLGQFEAQDTESGGIERIKPKNAVKKMGSDMRGFANLLLASTDDEMSFSTLVDRNGAEALKWMQSKGYITPTQYRSAFDSKGNLTAEAKNDLKGIMYQSIFQNGNTLLEEKFSKLPAKAQRAILATAYRDYDSPNTERLITEIQDSIGAYYALLQDPAFAGAKNYKEARMAVETWKRQYSLDDATGESYLPSERYSNFALLLATMYKGQTQTFIQNTFASIYDLVQGTQEETLFEKPDNTPRTLAEAINEAINNLGEELLINEEFKYNGQQRSNVLAGGSAAGQRRQQGSDRDAPSGERAEDGNGAADSGGRAVLPVSERGRQGDISDSQRRQSDNLESSEVRLSDEIDDNGRQFVISPSGNTVFGEIREDSGLTPAPIKLSEGVQGEDGKGYGLAHIDANHGAQIRKAGFASVEDFVSYVAKNYDEGNIRVGKRRDNGSPTFLIQVTDKHDNTLFIELSKDGSYWNVNSGGIFRKGYANKKETVVETEPQQPNNAVSTGSSLSENEREGITSSEPNGKPTVSARKGSESAGNKQVVNPLEFEVASGSRVRTYKSTPHEKVKKDGTVEITFSGELTYTKGAPKGHQEGEVRQLSEGNGFIKISPDDIDYEAYANLGRRAEEGPANEVDIEEGREQIEELLTPVLAPETGPKYHVNKIVIAPDGRIFADFTGESKLRVPLKRNPLDRVNAKAEREGRSIDDEVNMLTKLHWSNERAGNGEPFLIGSDGSIDLVKIKQEVFDKMGISKAPFRLTPSMVMHVYERHKKELKLKSPEDAVEAILDVMNNFDHVRQGRGNTFIFSVEGVRTNSARRAVTIVLEYDKGEWLGIKTVGYDRIPNLKELTTLWEKSEEKSSTTGVAPANVSSEQSSRGNRADGIASNQRVVVSEGKDSALSADGQADRGEQKTKISYDKKQDKWKGVPASAKFWTTKDDRTGEKLQRDGFYHAISLAEGVSPHIELLAYPSDGKAFLRVFVVDDYAETPERIIQALENEGYHVDLNGTSHFVDVNTYSDAVALAAHIEEIGLRLHEERVGSSAKNVRRQGEQSPGLFQYFTGSLSDLIAQAKQSAQGLIKKVIAPISPRLKNDLSSQGMQIDDDYNHVIDNNAIRHALKNHSGKKEEKRGQIPITDADFENIADIVETYDGVEVVPGNTSAQRIIYHKAYQDGTVIFVEEQRVGRKELAAVTMWKKKSPNLTDANRTETTLISDLTGVSTGKGSETEVKAQGAEKQDWKARYEEALQKAKEAVSTEEGGEIDESAVHHSVDFNYEGDLYMEAEARLNELMGGKGKMLSDEMTEWEMEAGKKNEDGIPSLPQIIAEIEAQENKAQTDAIIRKVKDLKKKHPGYIILVPGANGYTAVGSDARAVSKATGLPIEGTGRKQSVVIPSDRFNKTLEQLISSGLKVATVDDEQKDPRLEQSTGKDILIAEARETFDGMVSKSTHNVDIIDEEVSQTNDTLYAPIKVDGKRTNLSLFSQAPAYSTGKSIDGVAYYRDGLTYQEASDLSEEYNRHVGKTVCRDGSDELAINFENIDDAVKFEEWLGKELRLEKRKSSGEELTAEEVAIRDAVVDRLRGIGIEVIDDTEAAQKVLDEANRSDVSFAHRKSPRAEWMNAYVEAMHIVTGRDKKAIRKDLDKMLADAKREAKELYTEVLSGEINDVTLRRIDKYIDNATNQNRFYRPLSQRLPARAIPAGTGGGRTNAIDALYSRICESAVPANERAGAEGRRRIEAKKEECLEVWARATGHWHESIADFTSNTTPIGKGTDSDVYLSDDGKSVIKVSKGKFDNRKFPTDIDQVNLFNYVFPNSAYRILGYGRTADGHFVRYLEQPFVDFSQSTPLNPEERVEYMRRLGFEPKNEEKTLFSNRKVIVSDLQKSNIVKTRDGNIRVIDADVKLHTKDVGGNYTYPPVETDTEVPSTPIRLHRVYHGSGADFDAFDHSHMGEGEGAQAFGWGSYVTEVEGIGRAYAEKTHRHAQGVDAFNPYFEIKGLFYNRLKDKRIKSFETARKKVSDSLHEMKEKAEQQGNTAFAEYYKKCISLVGSFTENDYKQEYQPYIQPQSNLYTVEIPDDTGENYLDWYGRADRIIERVGISDAEYESNDMATGGGVYRYLTEKLGSDKAASEYLSEKGFTGIKYPAQATTGGRKDGAKNYVIFNEADLKIVDKVRFFRTADGEAYGFTVGGKIYIDPRIATAETPIHEYAHLWASALRRGNPKEWQNVVELMKDTPVWDKVKEVYPELKTDEEIADEVLATYSGQRGAERLREETRKAAYGEGDIIEKAAAVSAIERVKDALRRFWRAVANFLHIRYKRADEVADRVMSDLLEGVNPQQAVRENSLEAVNARFNEELQQQIDGTLPKGHVYRLGMPGAILRSAGIENLPIELSSERIAVKASTDYVNNHPFTLSAIQNLPKALNAPIAVFDSKTKPKSKVILTELQYSGHNFVVAMQVRKDAGKLHVEVNSIRSLYPKDSVRGILGWINNGLMKWVDKDKMQNFLHTQWPNYIASEKEANQNLIDQQRTNLADVEYLDLDSATKIVKDFENPSVGRENVRERGRMMEQEMAETSAEAKSGYAERLAEKFGTPIRIVDDTAELPESIRRRKIKGFYDVATGEVVVVVPNNADVADVAETVLHEVVAHKGLRELVGEENYDAFCDEVYNHLNGDLKSGIDKETTHRFLKDPSKGYEHHRRVAVDELFGRLSEKGFEDFTREERSIWTKLKEIVLDAINKFLGSLKLPKWVRLGDNELRYMLWRSHENLRGKGDYVAMARDVAKRNELGLNRNDVFRGRDNNPKREYGERVGREAERTGVDPQSRVAVVSGNENHGFRNFSEAREWAKENIVRTYGNEETGDKGDIRISGNAINKFLSESAVSKSASKDVHLAVLKVLPDVIRESIDAEQHPDYNKGADGERRVENGINPNVRIHRLYGAVNLGGKIYRVKVTLKEDLRNSNLAQKAYSYEATKIELLAGTLGKPKGDAPNTSNSIRAANLLKGVEKSYGGGMVLENDSEAREESADLSREPEKLFREADTPVQYEKAMARDVYEKRVSRGMYQMREALQDSMLSLREAMDAILKAEGKKGTRIEDVDGFENAYIGENRLSSTNKAECDAFANLLFKPLLKEVGKLAKNAKERAELTDYMMAKHGLERNEVMRQRYRDQLIKEKMGNKKPVEPKADEEDYDDKMAAYEKAMEYWENQVEIELGDELEKIDNRDYAGLTALTGENDVAWAETAAQQMVDDYEAAHDTAELWKKVNAVTGATLSKAYESGLMSKATYEDVKAMYDYYIPLRGFDEKTSDEAYAYLTDKHSAFYAPIKKAKGRSSKADDPFANMEAMAESAMMQGNRNTLVKQRFLNFALNHPSDLVSVSELWLQYDDVADEWKPAFPDNIDSNDSPAEVAQKMQDFEERMQQLAEENPDKYKKGKDAANIPYRVVENRDLHQHQVIVKRGGRDYVITVNGNPRLAQALNGQTNPDNDTSGAIGAILRAGESLNRQLSAFYTTRNPDFVASNFIRDMLYSNSMVWVKENPKYALHFHKNFIFLNPVRMKILLAKYRNGKLNMKDDTEKLFYQFMMNGGETGYVNIRDIDRRKNDLKRELKKYNGRLPIRKAWSLLGELFDELNRSVENCARFAAFMTSREMGRTIDRSIYDAKEISVNFNKKGSGAKFMGANGQTWLGNTAAFTSGLGRSGFVFWNAAIQGTTNFGRQVKRHPGKALTAMAAIFLLGALVAYLGYDDDDDDDKNSYYNLPEYVRRSNILFRAGDQWVSIPLPPEYRAIYGLGELTTSTLMGKEHLTDGELANQIAGQVSQIMPIDFMEGGGSLKAFIPSAIKPVAEVYTNTSWTGLPIYKDNAFNKNMPEWTKAYKSANKDLVELSETLNEASGGDKYTKGTIDINPAQVEHLLTGYFGGVASTIDRMSKMYETAVGQREYDPKSFLILNRIMKNGDERTEYRAMNNEYFRLKEEHDRLGKRIRDYERDTRNGIHDYSAKLESIRNSPEYERYKTFEGYRSSIDKLYDMQKEADYRGDQEMVKKIDARLTELKKEMINEIDEGRK